MKKRLFTFRNLILTATLICAASFLTPLIVEETLAWFDEWILEGKSVHEAQGTVVKKEYIKFNDKNNIYRDDDGILIERKIGAEDWRIYFKIDSFDYANGSKKIDEYLRKSLQDAEDKRCKEGVYHHNTVPDKNVYDAIEIGDKLAVSWQRIGGNQMQVVSVFPKRKKFSDEEKDAMSPNK